MTPVLAEPVPLADRLADRINPVALKELRQAVNSRFINGMLLTLLAVLLGILVTYAVTLDPARSGTRGDGAWLFGVMTSVLGAIAGFGLPLYVGIPLAVERATATGDLLRMTTLMPWQVVRGKMYAGLVLAGSIASACVPFIVITWLLRGVDVVTILGTLVTTAAGVSVALALAHHGRIVTAWTGPQVDLRALHAARHTDHVRGARRPAERRHDGFRGRRGRGAARQPARVRRHPGAVPEPDGRLALAQGREPVAHDPRAAAGVGGAREREAGPRASGRRAGGVAAARRRNPPIMTAAPAASPSRLAFLDDRVNPIVVKELRQAVKSWFIVGLLLLLLSVLTLIQLIWVMSSTDLGSTSSDGGRDLFLVFQGTLLAISLLGLPVYTGVRLAAERASATSDLLYVTTIRPWSIVWGKLAAGVVVTLLVFAACAPFMIVTYLLRGIDPPTILFVLGLDFLLVLSGLVLAIFLGALPVGLGMKVFLGLIGVAALLWTFGLTTGGVVGSLVFSGVGTDFADPEFLAGLAATLLLWGAGLLLLLLLVVAMIAPPSSDRAKPLRLFVTLLWLAGGATAVGMAAWYDDGELMLVWPMGSAFVLLPALLIASSERDDFGPRQRRAVPGNPLGKLASFVFSSGAAGGLVWASVLFGLSLLGAFLIANAVDSRMGNLDWLTIGLLVCGLFVFGYCLLATFLRQLFLKSPAKQMATGGIAAVLLALAMLAPPLIAFALDPKSWDRDEESWLFLNPFGVFFRSGRNEMQDFDVLLLCISAGLVLLGLLLNAKWFWLQWKRYAPLTRAETAAPASDGVFVAP